METLHLAIPVGLRVWIGEVWECYFSWPHLEPERGYENENMKWHQELMRFMHTARYVVYIRKTDLDHQLETWKLCRRID